MKSLIFLSPYSRSLFIKNSITEYGGAEVKVFNIVNILSTTKNYKTTVIIDSALEAPYETNSNNVSLISLPLLHSAKKLIPFFELVTKFLGLLTLNKFPFLRKILKPFKITTFSRVFTILENYKNKISKIDFIRFKITEYNINKQIEFMRNKKKFYNYLFCFGLNQQSFLFMKRFKEKRLSKYNAIYLGSDNDLNFQSQFYGEINYAKRKCLELCDFVICQNNFQKKKVNFYLPNKKVFILPNPINTNYKFAYNNIENRKYDVIWVGKLDKVKNPIIALNIARKLSNYKFLFLFNIQNDRYNFFDLMLRFKTSNMNFQIDVDYEVSDKFFSQSKIYMNTSLFEGFPNALLQAGKYGCPFISLNVNPDDIFNNDIGYNANGSKSIIEKKIKYLLTNKKELINKSENIKIYVEKKHSYEKIKEEIEGIIECVG